MEIKATSDSYGDTKYFRLEEVKKHDNQNELWMVIHNNVYDVTDFIDEHPGGAEILFDCGGVDVTTVFEDVGHSDDAVKMLEPYRIGSLIPLQCVSYSTTFSSGKTSKERVHSKVAMEREQRAKRREAKERQMWNEKFSIFILACITMLVIVIYIILQRVKWGSAIVQ